MLSRIYSKYAFFGWNVVLGITSQFLIRSDLRDCQSIQSVIGGELSHRVQPHKQPRFVTATKSLPQKL